MINNYTLTCSLSLQHRVLPLMHYMIINYGKLCIIYYASLKRIIKSTKAGKSESTLS